MTTAANIINGTDVGEFISDTTDNDSISALGGNDSIFAFSGGDDTIDGGDGNDWIWDTLGNNSISGGNGNDTIISYGGTETLSGGAGDDSFGSSSWGDIHSTIIDGGDGNDIFEIYSTGGAPILATGGQGKDIYLAQSTYGDGNATVTDFVSGPGGDVIDLSDMVRALNNYDGGNPFVSGHIRFIQSGSDTLIQVDANGTAYGSSFYTTLILQNVDAASLTPENFRGYTFDGSPLSGHAIDGTGSAETLSGSYADDTLNGLGGDDKLFGDGGNDLLNGGDGNDTLDGYLGSDTINGGAGDDVIGDYYGQNLIHGGDGNDILYLGGQGVSHLYGDTGNDTFSGSLGEGATNILTGGEGSDFYAIYPNVGTIEITDFAAGPGGDVYDLNAVLAGAFDYTAGTNPFADGHVRLVQSGVDVLIQYDADGAANSGWNFRTIATLKNLDATTLTAENFGGFSPAETPHNETITGTPANDTLIGHGGDDVLWGLAGNDRLDGGPGDDTMHGGAGDDTYVVNNDGDVVSETEADGSDSGGIDTVIASVWNYTLGDHVENLVLAGTDGYFAFGNGLDNAVTGNAGNNLLEGYDGNDTISGGDGNDSFWGDGGSDVLNGDAGNDYMVGGDGNDTLDGGTGDDSMYGGSGNDVYYVDSTGDVIGEAGFPDSGSDRVYSSINYTLGDYLENLNLTGTANLSGTGNGLGNTLTGNSGNNLLSGLDGNDTILGQGGADTILGGNGNDSLSGGEGDDQLDGGSNNDRLYGGAGNDTLQGGGGGDTMWGGAGDDVYYVDNVGDSVYEELTPGTDDGGYDKVLSSISYTVTAHVEELDLLGSSNINGTGNALDNYIYGNAGSNLLSGLGGNDTLVGNGGIDTLVGGNGDDTYVVSNVATVIIETNTTDWDAVWSTSSYTLAANLEELDLLGSSNINATGNAGDNFLYGNSGANQLSGLVGDDTLVGNGGNDTLTGGAGVDTFVFSAAAINGKDAIQDFVHGTDQLWFTGSDYGFAAGHALTTSEFTAGSAAVGSHAQFIWNAATHTLYWDDDGTGSHAAIAIATFNPDATLTASDLHFS